MKHEADNKVSRFRFHVSRHEPVLLQEVLEYLRPRPGAFIIDGTVNGGGHAREILTRIAPDGRFLGIDLDPALAHRLHQEIGTGKHVSVIHGNYAELPDILRKRKLPKADGLLLDLGFSSEHVERSGGKGFSFLSNEPLAMTYDPHAVPVAQILRELEQSELAQVIRTFGGERMAERIARAIVNRRRVRKITTTRELADVVSSAVPREYERGRIHPATRTFQALRIFANDELGNLERILRRLPEILRPGGRIVIITFHSLEDRIVKHAFREAGKNGILTVLTKKPLAPTPEEIRRNPRSRSAKLRAAERA